MASGAREEGGAGGGGGGGGGEEGEEGEERLWSERAC